MCGCVLLDVDDWRRACRDRGGKSEQVKVTSLPGYGRSLPGAYCGVAVSHTGDDSFDGDVTRTPITVLPPYSDDGHYETQSGSALAVGDAMSLQLLPNASTSSSASSSTSTTDIWSSTQRRAAATTGRRNGSAPWPGRPLPPPPKSPDGHSGLELGDDVTSLPHLDGDRLHRIQSLGPGHFGEVFYFTSICTFDFCLVASYICSACPCPC